MATSYPTSIDDYNDPTEWNPALHNDGTGQHGNAYDAIIAIEETIGTTGSFNFGSGSGTITEITSTGATVTITNPTGPVVNLETSGGGGLPGLSGAGDPISANPTTPTYVGELYEDTTGSGLYIATSLLSSDWMPLGGDGSSSYNGLTYYNASAGVTSVELGGAGTGSQLYLRSGSSSGSSFTLTDDHILAQSGGTQFNIFAVDNKPNGIITATNVGDLCIDTSTPGVWQATAADDAHWIQFGGILPTSSAGLVTGSFYTVAGVVNVA